MYLVHIWRIFFSLFLLTQNFNVASIRLRLISLRLVYWEHLRRIGTENDEKRKLLFDTCMQQQSLVKWPFTNRTNQKIICL